jgi:hypothetical protein
LKISSGLVLDGRFTHFSALLFQMLLQLRLDLGNLRLNLVQLGINARLGNDAATLTRLA